jgi:hypothetical protein
LPDSVVGQFCCIFIFLHLKLQFALSNKKKKYIVFICVTMILCDDMLLSERILHWRIGASPVYFSPSNTFLGMLLLCNFILCIGFFCLFTNTELSRGLMSSRALYLAFVTVQTMLVLCMFYLFY